MSGPTPAAGSGAVRGRVLYNGAGASNLDVKLCEEFHFFNGCSGRSYKATTDQEGAYLFANITPGEYSLAVRVFNTDKYLYTTSGIMSARKYKVEADKTLEIEARNIHKFDLKLTSPKFHGKVAAARPALTWEPYPGAAYYKVSMRADGVDPIFSNYRTDSTQVSPDKPLLNGSYRWDVEAYNSQDVKIAVNNEQFEFSVVGQAASLTQGK